jgi:hypothetical protein
MAKLPYKQKETDSNRARRISAYELFAGRLADAFKLVGAGNGTAFFATIVAVNYFPQKPEMTEFLKKLSLSYLGGVFLFVLSYFALTWFFAKQTPGFSGRTQYDPNFKSAAFGIAVFLSGASLGVWFYASIRAAIVIASFSR